MDKKKILVVDDEEKFCKMLKANLEKDGPYEVQIETKGVQALALAKTFRPHLIIMDILMPDLGGCEAAAQIKNDEKLKNVPIIFLTALAKKKDTEIFGGIVDGRPFIAKPVISKPVKTKDLIQIIEQNLNKPQGEPASAPPA